MNRSASCWNIQKWCLFRDHSQMTFIKMFWTFSLHCSHKIIKHCSSFLISHISRLKILTSRSDYSTFTFDFSRPLPLLNVRRHKWHEHFRPCNFSSALFMTIFSTLYMNRINFYINFLRLCLKIKWNLRHYSHCCYKNFITKRLRGNLI